MANIVNGDDDQPGFWTLLMCYKGNSTTTSSGHCAKTATPEPSTMTTTHTVLQHMDVTTDSRPTTTR